MKELSISVGISNFAEILKTTGTKVTLITRPRLFAGLKIAQRQDLCAEWMNQWPTNGKECGEGEKETFHWN